VGDSVIVDYVQEPNVVVDDVQELYLGGNYNSVQETIANGSV